MTEADLILLKASVDKVVQIETADGETLTVKVLSVFGDEDDADMFYELVATSRPESYVRRGKGPVGYSLPLASIVSVKAATVP